MSKRFIQTTLNFSQPNSPNTSLEASQSKKQRQSEDGVDPNSVETMTGSRGGKQGRGGGSRSRGAHYPHGQSREGRGNEFKETEKSKSDQKERNPSQPSRPSSDPKSSGYQVNQDGGYAAAVKSGGKASEKSKSDQNEEKPPFSRSPLEAKRSEFQESSREEKFQEETPMETGDEDESKSYNWKSIESDKPPPMEASSKMWRGTAISDLRTAPKCYQGQEKALRPDKKTKVLFQVPAEGWKPEEALKPYPEKPNYNLSATVSEDYVFMPYSSESFIPNPDKPGEIQQRWKVIEKALNQPISSSFDLADAILTYNSHYRSKWDFSNLHRYCEKLSDLERMELFSDILPAMVKLALGLPWTCTKPIPYLRQHKEKKLVMTQKQAACLLANAFFCTFPRRNVKKRGLLLPNINFSSLFNQESSSSKLEKLKCIFHYFGRVTKDMPTGVISFDRQVLWDPPKWQDENKTYFTDLHVSTYGTIEDDGIGMLQADFANKLVGGGVLGRGCVQEEIRFLICPEMILSRLFTEALTDSEVLIMTGCERFSNYSGYSGTFKWTENYEDTTEKDSWGRFCTEVVAMDAQVVRKYEDQFRKDNVERELKKAYCAFRGTEGKKNLSAVSTGNWGCGAFGGDKHLKALIQMIAASCAGREVCFFTFGDNDLCMQLSHTHDVLAADRFSVADVISLIEEYYRKELKIEWRKDQRKSLLEHICTSLGGGWIGKTSESTSYSSQDFNSQDYKVYTP